MLRTRNRYWYGSTIRYCTTHSTTAAFRSPVSMFASSALSTKELRTATVSDRKPNSSFNWRLTGTLVNLSTKGIMKWSPDSVWPL